MASTFHITQDPEKENPINLPMKEKSLNGPGKILHSLGATFKDVKQGRANFTVLNNSINVRHVIGNNPNSGDIAASINAANNNNNNKVAFREVSNINKTKPHNGVYDDNRNLTNLAAKKSAVVPVEQFKTFSVYEDQNDGFIETTTTIVTAIRNQQQQEQQHQRDDGNVTTTVEETSQVVVVNKENYLYTEKQKVEQKQQQQTQAKGILTERSDVLAPKYEYILDTTPMSVSEVLSPMSVDRSILTSQSFADDSNSQEIADESDKDARLEPRNDRQRFYEVVEYQRDILEYFRDSEKKHRPKPHYMSRQNDINYSMRTILVDWLVEVSEEYNLDTETLYLSVTYIDRFLSHMSVVRNKLQLVGTAAMYIASKYEEIYPPDVAEFVFITDDTYNKAQVLRMEQIILKILAFDLCTPTAYVFVNTYSVLIDIPDHVKYLTLYICELSLLEADPYLRFHPSIISAASLALARYLSNFPIWSAELEEITAYRLEDMKDVFLCLCKTHTAALTLSQQAVQEKYRAEKYRSVSTIKPVSISEEQYIAINQDYNEMQANLAKSKEQITTALSRVPLKVNSFFKF